MGERIRIGVDASPMMGLRGGVGWYTYYLLRSLLQLKEDVEFVCYVKPGALAGGAAQKQLAEWQYGPCLRWVEAGRTTMRWRGFLDRLDLYHGTNFKMQTEGRYGGIVTIHDLWLDRCPQYSKKLLGQRVSFLKTRRAAWKARKVITISQHSARDIVSLYGLPPERIVIIPNGVSREFYPDADPSMREVLRTRFGLPTERFILFVGGADPRKNHRALLQAYARASSSVKAHSVVMVGSSEHRFGSIKESARGLGLLDRVVCIDRCSIDELRTLYSHSDLFVFPSLYEGFGMPVVEAMACGAPVITSDTTALPEVVGDAAVLVNPEDTEKLAQAITDVIENTALREELRARGFKRARLFTWESVAARMIELYRECCR